MEMDERKRKILQAIISDYIDTAEPVGSRTIAKKYNLGISSATIRNEMADLEDMGYLEQIHSSSGRRPSDKGYRLYVDKLMKVPTLSPKEELIIKGQLLSAAIYEMDRVIKQAAVILTELTNLTCIVKTPSVKKSGINTIQLLDIGGNNILTVIVTDTGIIKNDVINVKRYISPEVLLKLNNLLNIKLRNLTVEDINIQVIDELKNEMYGYEDIFVAIIPALYDTLRSADTAEVHFEGATNIFNYPEYNDICKAKEFLALLDDREKLNALLSDPAGISIKIGEENGIEGAKDCSVITAVYTLHDKPLGAIGLIGPTRIQYSKVVSVLKSIIDEINENLNNNHL